MQAPAWSPPSGTLGALVAAARDRAVALVPRERELMAAAESAAAVPPFASALRGEDVGVVAEVKRRSPSRGSINAALDAADRAAAYARGGAAAISVLTEPEQFGGSNDDLTDVAQRVVVPLLRKDFHVHPLQLVEARAIGASAALLIVRALAPDELRGLVADARALRLEVLVEVRDEAELDRALAVGAHVIGVNNRDLETLRIDPLTGARLIGRIPPDRIAVAESGMRTPDDVETAARWGADAVLVGTSLSAAADPEAAVRALTGKRRASRGD